MKSVCAAAAFAMALVFVHTASAQVTLYPVNNGFETPDTHGGYGYATNANGPGLSSGSLGWTFVGATGIGSNGSAIGPIIGATNGNSNGTTSTAGQCAFIQLATTIYPPVPESYICQTLTFGAGTASVTFSIARRGEFGDNPINVKIDDQDLGTYLAANQTGFNTVTTPTVPVTAGPHTLYFVGTNHTGQDNTQFIDNVSVTNDAPPVMPDLVTAELGYHVIEDQSGQNNGPIPFNAHFVIAARIGNVGAGPAGSFKVRFFASRDSTIDSNDVALGDVAVNGLAAGETMIVNTATPIQLPQSLPWFGRIYLGVVLDPENSVSESNELNNSNSGQGMDVRSAQLYDPLPSIGEAPRTFNTQIQAFIYLVFNGYFLQLPNTGRGWTKLLPGSSTVVSRFDGISRSGIAYRLDAGIKEPDAAHGGRYWIEVQGTAVIAEPCPETAPFFGATWFNYVRDFHSRF